MNGLACTAVASESMQFREHHPATRKRLHLNFARTPAPHCGETSAWLMVSLWLILLTAQQSSEDRIRFLGPL